MIPRNEFLNEIESLLTGAWLTDLSNFSAHLFLHLPQLNWVGFYLSDGKRLRLGPFQGKPACVEIAFDRGVCGKAFSSNEALIVDDVHEFPGHIACDEASRSEMVLPLIVDGKKLGVLDLDAPITKRFTEEDLVLVRDALAVLSARLTKNPPVISWD